LGVFWTVIVGVMSMQMASAAVSPEEAKQLGTTLTKLGAEKAGNSEGSIPAYTGGLQSSTLKVGEDPFAAEKPLYTINASNMAKYEAMLSEGTKTLLKRYPDYRVNVYPTHRTMSFPDWVLENTVKNATTAKLGGPVEGDDLLGEGPDGMPHPGVPFPIPKTGYEVMWNNTAKYSPPLGHIRWSGFLVDESGRTTELAHLNGH
jgi:hypothetical protein